MPILNSPEKFSAIVSILVAGSKSIGKTQLVNRLIGDTFSETYSQTFSIDLRIKIKDQDLRFFFWDSPGAEKLRSILEPYYKVNAFIISYDLSNRSSFDAVDTYTNNIHSYLKKHNKKENPLIFLVATKGDLTGSQVVSDHEGQAKAQRLKCTKFIKTSAKNNENIEALFNILMQECTKSAIPKPPKKEKTLSKTFSSYSLIFLSLASIILLSVYLGPISATLSFFIGLRAIIQARRREARQKVESEAEVKLKIEQEEQEKQEQIKQVKAKTRANAEANEDDLDNIPIHTFKSLGIPEPQHMVAKTEVKEETKAETKIDLVQEARMPNNSKRKFFFT